MLKLQREIGALTFDGSSGHQNLPLAGGLEVAVEPLAEKQASPGPSNAVILRLMLHAIPVGV